MPKFPFSRSRGEGAAGGKEDALERAPMLAVLEPELRQRVRKRLTRRHVGAGKPLLRQGEPADALYIVGSGRLRIFVGEERPGRERVLQFLGPGETLGEVAFMAHTPYVSNTAAVDDSMVWRLARTDFDALVGQHEGLLRYLASLIGGGQSTANARLAADSAPDEMRAPRAFVTAVYSPRGGAGVTTLAVNLALALAGDHPDNTVLFDLDVLFGHAVANLWLQPRGVLALVAPATIRQLDRGGLDYYLLPHTSSLRIFLAAARPEEGQTISGDHVRAALSTLRRHFGHIVLDLPHGFNEVTLAGLELADRVLLVATPEQVTLHDVVECRRIFDHVLGLEASRITYLLNHPQPYASLEASDFAAATGATWSEIPHGGEAPSTAALRGESLLGTRPGNAVARAATHFAEMVGAEAREVAALSARPL